MFQRQPVHKLHCDERFAVLIVYFVDRADVRMVQCRKPDVSSFRFQSLAICVAYCSLRTG